MTAEIRAGPGILGSAEGLKTGRGRGAMLPKSEHQCGLRPDLQLFPVGPVDLL